MKKIYLYFFVLIICYQSFSQDPNFSQFYSSPLTLNPAHTGKFDGILRGTFNYRNQWPAVNNAFITGTASVDFSILQKKIPETDRFGIGILGLTERNGNGILQNNYGAVSIAYHKGLDEDGYHQLGLGFQAAISQKRLDVTKAVFADQLTSLGFTGVTSEVFSNNNLSLNFFDLNVGLLYSGSTNDNNYFYGGISAYHLNKPKESFRGANYTLNQRFTIHGGAYLPLSDVLKLHISGIHQRQGGASETNVGLALGYSVIKDDYNPAIVYFGTWSRFKDAVIPYVGLEYGSYRLGITYDVNTSSLNAATNNRGGIEVSFIYIKRPSRDGKPIKCPVF